MKIEIEGLTKPQEDAIKDMLCEWERLGNIGSSRWTAFYADGDGNFHPKIKVDGVKPEQVEYVDAEKREDQWKYFTILGKNQIKGLFIDYDLYSAILSNAPQKPLNLPLERKLIKIEYK